MSRHCGVLTAPPLLPRPVGVAEDMEVAPPVLPQCRVLKGRPRPSAVISDLKIIVRMFSGPEPRHQVIHVYSC